MEKVSVNRGVLIGVVFVAVFSLLALAFVLGRASGSRAPSPQPSGGDVPGRLVASPGPGTPPPVQDGQPPSSPTPATMSRGESTETRPDPEPSSPRTAGVPGADRVDPDRTAVAAYFDAVDRIQPTKMSGDAEGAANELATALAKGDTSELDRMIRETESAKATLAAITPPPPCAAHYRESLGSLDDALEMLRTLKSTMESADPARLADVATHASALRTRAEALERDEQALRRRYGLTR